MRIKINKRNRVIMLAIVVIIICFVSFSLFDEVKNPQVEEQKVSLYRYNNKSNITYKVFLKPNLLYEKESLDEGGIYVTEFVDYIKAVYNYSFEGEEPVDIKGDYEVIGKIEGFSMDKDKKIVTIWEKNLNISPKKPFQAEDDNFSLKEEIQVNFNEINQFAKQVIETSKINSDVRFTVFMNINISAQTNNGIIEEDLSPMMIIPLNTSYFTISGELGVEKPGNIEAINNIQLPVNRNIVTIYGIGIGVLCVLLVLFIFLVEEKEPVNPIEKKLKQIFKKHGDRLVALNSEIAATCEQYSEVYSIDDLVRIADEIGKPIMYRYSPNYKDISTLYVSDESQMYSLDIGKTLMKPITERKKKKTNKKESININQAITEPSAIQDQEDI